MGIHYVNGALVGDASLDAATPEVLVYQQLPNGKLRLVAAEYIVFQGAWLSAGNTAAPTLFGQTLTLVPAGNRYGLRLVASAFRTDGRPRHRDRGRCSPFR